MEVRDTTAAGDTFNAALAVALAEGKAMEQALPFANAAAAISVTRLGAQPSAPERKEIEALLAQVKAPSRAGAPELKPVKAGALAQAVPSGALPTAVNFASEDLKQNQLGE